METSEAGWEGGRELEVEEVEEEGKMAEKEVEEKYSMGDFQMDEKKY